MPFYNSLPNYVLKADGFYISYNNADIDIYGEATTAIVIGQMEKFYILRGNHQQQYAKLMDKGLEACLLYFFEHMDEIHHYSIF